jgi:hypothetical protein
LIVKSKTGLDFRSFCRCCDTNAGKYNDGNSTAGHQLA